MGDYQTVYARTGGGRTDERLYLVEVKINKTIGKVICIRLHNCTVDGVVVVVAVARPLTE